MANNIQTDANETKLCVSDDQVSLNSELQQTPRTGAATQSINGVYEKEHSLAEKANNTFQELYKTLENEQTKLLELEEKRKKLQEEMLLLKAEIEQQKQSFKFDEVQSVADNLSSLNKTSGNVLKKSKEQDCDQTNNLYTCCADAERMPATARNIVPKDSVDCINEETTTQEHVQYIKNELQNVLAKCLKEQ